MEGSHKSDRVKVITIGSTVATIKSFEGGKKPMMDMLKSNVVS